MAQQFEVDAATGKCSVTGKPFEENQEFYTVLFESGESFTRSDFSLEGWSGPPEGAFCFFKSRVPVKEKRKKMLVNNELLIGFFQRLDDESEPVRLQFRFVLALILMRKRILRYDGSVTESHVETWTMTLTRDQSVHQVVNPNLTDAQIEGVSEQLSAILHSDMGEWAGAEAADAPAPSEQADSTPEAP